MTRYQFIDDSGETRLAGTLEPDPGGSSAVVSCILSRDNAFDIRTVGSHPILWDALYNNLEDFTPLAAIPAGLGLAFTYAGAAATITTTAAGVWSLGFAVQRSVDATWVGSLGTGEQAVSLAELAPLVTQVAALPSGAVMAPHIDVTTQATQNPYVMSTVYLSIVRLA